ncbi:MAG: LicD family protein [Tannerellaceae bacterium]|jgi:lipopolysaccharide cholinephosphotransferase|nr:LicD family protein [Tannerellaceae bacterium]
MNSITNYSEKFPDNRIEGETVLRQAQLVLLRMLKIVDDICRRHQIAYWLCSGTLLGAVRHKGFIPWDDDLDICMLRDDYERFIQIAKVEFPDDMALQTRETDPDYHYLPLPCKVRDRKSFTFLPTHKDEGCENGLYLDVFPVDRYHLNPLVFRWERLLKTYGRFICQCLDSVYYSHESCTRRILAFFHPVFHFLVTRYMRFAEKKIQRNKCLGEDCHVGHGFDTLWKRYFKYDDIYPLIEIDFEGASFYAPHSLDVYLRTLYGADYMTPPPEAKRRRHASVIKPVLP